MYLLKFALVCLLSYGFSINAYANSVHGIFKVVKGKVTVKNKTGKEQRARIGLKIFPQDTILTGKNSRAKVVMTDQNEINVSPESEIQLSKYEFDAKSDKKNVLINVIYGKIRSKVSQKYDGDNKFQVKTPSAVAGVRGTDFITSFNPMNQQTQIVTFEGRVEFGLPAGLNIVNSVMVGVGQSSSLVAGTMPSAPIEIPVAELGKFNTDSDASLASEPPKTETNSGPREPANQNTDKIDAPKKEPTPDSAAKQPKAGTTPARAPNSIGGGSMLIANDMPAAGGNVYIPNGQVGPQLPPTYISPVQLNPECTFCRDAIESGNRKLILNINHQ